MGFSRQEYWSGLPLPSPGDLPNPGIKPQSPTLQADSLLSELPRKPQRAQRLCPVQTWGVWMFEEGSQPAWDSPLTTPKSPPHPSSLAPVRLRPALGSVRVLLGHVAHPSPRELLAHRRVLVVGLPSAIPRGSEGCPALEIKGCSSFPFGWSFGFRSPLIWACGSLVPLFFWGRLNPMDVAFIFLNFYF